MSATRTRRRRSAVAVPEAGPKTGVTAWLLNELGDWVEVDAPWKDGDAGEWASRSRNGRPLLSRLLGPAGLRLDVHGHRRGVDLSNTFAPLIGVITGPAKEPVDGPDSSRYRFVFIIRGLPGMLAAVRHFEAIRQPDPVALRVPESK